MTQDDLPDTLYVASMQFPNTGTSPMAGGFMDFQISDELGKIFVPVWADLERAATWLKNGGLDAYIREDGETAENRLRMGCKAVIRSLPWRENLCITNHGYVHFEPDIGTLLSPPERRIDLGRNRSCSRLWGP